MAEPTTHGTTTKRNGGTETAAASNLKKDGTPRKTPERKPRTPEDIAMAQVSNALKRISPELRPKVLAAMNVLYGKN